jgi:uncharacterized protein YbaR (Trm112 family)/SAM-dependent methyltransferase
VRAAAALLDLLACPRCDRALEGASDVLRCPGCRVEFPSVAGVPWLFAEPAAALDEWRSRLRLSLQRSDRELEQLRASLARENLRPATRARLAHLAAATEDHGKRLRALLAPLELERHTAAYATQLALRTRLPPDQGLTTYYANVHRDWGWGDEENEVSATIVDGLLADAAPARVLVLGSGAGRLAYDLHRRRTPALTVTLDFNPLLVLLAEHVARGERVELYEFPLAPSSTAEQAVLRTLAAPAPAPPGLEHVLGDAHRPPFKRGAFDVVLTPWLVDILPEPFESLAARVSSLLTDGGRWINFGSLSFHDPDASARLGVEECVAVLEEAGFGAVAMEEHDIPYMCSPASRHGRRERVVAWRAAKLRDLKKVPRHYALPDWIVRGTEPVPLTESFQMQALSTRIHAFIMSLIDGRRSLKDMAKLIVEQRLMSADEAESAVRSFLIKMHDDSKRPGLY